MNLNNHPRKSLPYEVTFCTSYYKDFVPENILIDDPNDLSSRWATDDGPEHFIILKLFRPAVLKAIRFGKGSKPNACNLKRFKVFGWMARSSEIELADSGLSNDIKPEEIPLRTTIENHPFCVQYAKIQPLESWSPNNFTIFSIQLIGIDQPDVLSSIYDSLPRYKDTMLLRLMLKYFRQKGLNEAFNVLQKTAGVRLEDERLTQLYRALVTRGRFGRAETLFLQIVNDFVSQGTCLFEPTVHWKEVVSPRNVWPSARGGHQMVLDSHNNNIYLFGGYNGSQDLNDFWRFNLTQQRWYQLEMDTSLTGGPSARSCHRMCIDPDQLVIYCLGRFLSEEEKNSAECRASELWAYSICHEKWNKVQRDTAEFHGPPLLHDHQMVFDEKTKCIFVFGGRVAVSPNSSNEKVCYEGLWRYDVRADCWTRLTSDQSSEIKSRCGHSMVFHAGRRELYIFGGTRYKETPSSIGVYNVDTHWSYLIAANEFTVRGSSAFLGDVSSSSLKPKLPTMASSQRATIDPARNEIYVFCKHITKVTGSKQSRDSQQLSSQQTMPLLAKREQLENSIWIYRILKKEWVCVYRHSQTPGNPAHFNNASAMKMRKKTTSLTSDDTKTSSFALAIGQMDDDVAFLRAETQFSSEQLPVPRFAQHVVYCPKTATHYLFGGNPGEPTRLSIVNDPNLLGEADRLVNSRLNDFWMFRIVDNSAKIIRRARFLIRQQRFLEMEPGPSALNYLQTKLHELLDQSDAGELDRFQHLSRSLFMSGPAAVDSPPQAYIYHGSTPTRDPSTLMVISEADDDSDNSAKVFPGPAAMAPSTSSPQTDDLTSQPSTAGDSVRSSGTSPFWLAKRTHLFDCLTQLLPSAVRQPEEDLAEIVQFEQFQNFSAN